MEEWSTYTVGNFVPFTTEVYLRLIERVNEAWWPLHLAAAAIGVVALVLVLAGRRRLAGPVLGLLWAWTAYGFFHQFYANLNWAGVWFARAFYLQALLLAFLMPVVCRAEIAPPVRARTGLLLAGIGLVWPLISAIGRDNLLQAEVVGIHPEPTAIFSLGAILLTLQGRWLWIMLPVPILWCLVSGLSLWVLGLFQAALLFAAAATVMLGVVWKKTAAREA